METQQKKGYPKRVAQLNQPFVRITQAEIAKAHDSGLSHQWAVYLMLHAYLDSEDEQGYLSGHCSRKEISQVLGLTQRQVSNATSRLIRDGIVAIEKSGHNGRASIYRLIGTSSREVPTDKGTSSREVPTADNKADINKKSSTTSTYKAVGTSSREVPEELFKNSSSNNCSTSKDKGQFHKEIGPAPVAKNKDIKPLSDEQLSRLPCYRGEKQ